MEGEWRSGWALGLSLVEVMLLLCFAATMVYVTDSGAGRAPETQGTLERSEDGDVGLQARLDAATEKNSHLERQVKEMSLILHELKVMVGAKAPSKEGLQEAVENLKRGYALCRKNGNTLIEASVQHGEETVAVIGEIPADLAVSFTQGDQTSDLEEIVSFLQDVYQYEKDRNCRFTYRLKYATDHDYKKGRAVFEKYFYPEKMIKTGSS